MKNNTMNNSKLNHDEIIAKKIAFLNGYTNDDLDPEMHSIVVSNLALQQELSFIESIWGNTKLSPQQQPSDATDARFYQMLHQANQHNVIDPTESNALQVSFISKINIFIKRSLTLQSAAQFAMLIILFFSGWQMNNITQPIQLDTTTELVKRIDSLSTIVAASMLQHQSATERLAGVSYAKNAGLNNQNITSILIKLLNNDHSNAVRLAVVDMFANGETNTDFQSQMIASLSTQQNPLVQLALIQLLLNTDLKSGAELVTQLLEQKKLMPEVRSFLEELEVKRSKVINQI